MKVKPSVKKICSKCRIIRRHVGHGDHSDQRHKAAAGLIGSVKDKHIQERHSTQKHGRNLAAMAAKHPRAEAGPRRRARTSGSQDLPDEKESCPGWHV